MESARRGEKEDGIALEGGVGGNPDTESTDLVLLDLPEVDENASLDVAVIPVALGEASVNAATLGAEDIEIESPSLGRHGGGKGGKYIGYAINNEAMLC